MKKICVVTGTRAEYGLLRNLISKIEKSSALDLALLVTGSHLSKQFGNSIDSILSDGFKVSEKIDIGLTTDTAAGVTRSMGQGLIGFGSSIEKLKPDLMLLTGDRYEMLAAASASMIARVPIAHIHGGELTEGSFDDSIRHCITKMSHLHFVAAKEYKKRVIQLGEEPRWVFEVGGLGVDALLNVNLLERSDLESALDFKLKNKNLIITFHPVTRGNVSSEDQLDELLKALNELENTGLIFTMPNADNENKTLSRKIKSFCSDKYFARFYQSLGQELYLSCLKNFDGVVGNSSSGLLEAPSLKTGTVDIGDRQKGRLRASSVINCKPKKLFISKSIKKLLSTEFQKKLKFVQNPYGIGGASKKIIEVLESVNLGDFKSKRFFDLNF